MPERPVPPAAPAADEIFQTGHASASFWRV
jgi:hypothetical protein